MKAVAFGHLVAICLLTDSFLVILFYAFIFFALLSLPLFLKHREMHGDLMLAIARLLFVSDSLFANVLLIDRQLIVLEVLIELVLHELNHVDFVIYFVDLDDHVSLCLLDLLVDFPFLLNELLLLIGRQLAND